MFTVMDYSSVETIAKMGYDRDEGREEEVPFGQYQNTYR